jgi:hypothetical protein
MTQSYTFRPPLTAVRKNYSITSSAAVTSKGGGKAEGLRSLEIDDQLKAGRLLDWNISGLCAPENLSGELGDALENFREPCSIESKPLPLQSHPNKLMCGGFT